jgi:Domain of unknown function (DUF4234)
VRSRGGYWIGGGLIAAGVVGAVLWFVTSAMRLSNEVNDFQRLPVPGDATMRLDARKYVIYYEGRNAERFEGSIEIAIADAGTGAALAVAPYRGSLTYSFDRDGSALATVTPPRDAAYVIRTASREPVRDAQVALGRSLAWPILRSLLGTFAIAGLLVGSGVIVLVVTGVRRRPRGAQPRPWTQEIMAQELQLRASEYWVKLRSPWAAALLPFATFGVYLLVWWYRINRELRDFGRARGHDLGQNPTNSLLALFPGSFLIVPFFVTFWRGTERTQAAARVAGREPLDGWIALILFIVVFPAYCAYVQSGLNKIWRAEADAVPDQPPQPAIDDDTPPPL